MASGFFARDDSVVAMQVANVQEVAVQEAAAIVETVTSNVRGWAGCMIGGGILLACTGWLAAPGAVLAVVGLVMFLLAPTNHARTQAMVEEAAEGGGCWAALGAVAGAVMVMVIAAVAVTSLLVGGAL